MLLEDKLNYLEYSKIKYIHSLIHYQAIYYFLSFLNLYEVLLKT